MGSRCSRHQQVAQQQPKSNGAASQQVGEQPVIPSDLINFLNTSTGATWLADVLLEWPGHVEKLRTASLSEVNAFVIAKYKEFRDSKFGRRLIYAPQHRAAVQHDTLMIPVYIIEDLVRQRLRHKITRNWWSTGWFIAIRTPFMCAAVYFTKHLVKKHILQPHADGRCKKLIKAASFFLDELVPVSFYGPMLTYGLLVRKMVKELEEGDS